MVGEVSSGLWGLAFRPLLERCGATLVALSVFGVGACSPRQPVPSEGMPPQGSLVLVGAGSTFSALLFDRWFSLYHDAHPKVFIKYDAAGSGEGVRRFIGRNIKDSEQVAFGASDSALSDAQLADMNDAAVMLPVTGGCVVLAYHLPGISAPLKLTREAYAGIFLGEVKKWSDDRIARANPGVDLPNLPISRVVRRDSSGTTFALTAHLAAISEKWRGQYSPATSLAWPGDVLPGRGNEGVAGLVQNNPGTIGYVGYEFAHRLSLSVAALENGSGEFVPPSAPSCGAGLATVSLPENLRGFVTDPVGKESYPIVTFSWVLLRTAGTDPTIAVALQDLFRWCLQEGQTYSAELGYVPLPNSIVTKAQEALTRLQTSQ